MMAVAGTVLVDALIYFTKSALALRDDCEHTRLVTCGGPSCTALSAVTIMKRRTGGSDAMHALLIID
jgi:hypothetical protein